MWRFILLGVVVVAADERWSRQANDRRQGDWVPVSAPCISCRHKGRSVDQETAAASLPSVLTPPAQQHPRLLPPPPPDGLFQHAATSGFSFPGQQSFSDNKPRQFLSQQNFNSRPLDQSTFRFKGTPQIPDSTGIPSNLFAVGPQQFTQNPPQQNTLLSPPQFLGTPFIPQPQKSPLHQFVQFNSPQILPQNLPFSDFTLPPNPPVFLSGNIPPPQQQGLFNQIPPSLGQSPGRFTPNITNDFKQDSKNQNQGKEEVQLLYVPVETLRQRGRNIGKVRGKKIEQSHSGNNFDQISHQTERTIPIQTTKPFFRPQINDNEQFFVQNQFQNQQAIQETTAPQIQYNENIFTQQNLGGQEQTTYSQEIRNQQSGEIVTPAPTSNNKYQQINQKQNDGVSNLNNQQYTFQNDQYQLHSNQERVTPQPSLDNTNQNYFTNPQFSSFNTFNNNQDYQQQGVTSAEQQTTIPPPHQPPLSVYMETTANSKIGDVLTHLKNAKTIPVLDTIGPDSPQVFVGPSNLNPPSGYLKFELPYLSSLDNNRVERKVDRLPFFVAPLNFQPPPGYSKIPFPAPHIGSVVVSNITVLKTALHEKPDEYFARPDSNTPSTINQYSISSDVSPLSPQLPSLVNSLQDERYFPTTTELPVTTTPVATTQVYTTPYRRNPNRGTQRVYTTTTTEQPIRRPNVRQRRPGRPQTYRNSQVVSTTTEPTIDTTSAPLYEQQQQEEQQKIYSDITTEIPVQQVFNQQQNYREQIFDSSNINSGEQFNTQDNPVHSGPQTNFNNHKQQQQQQQQQQQDDQFNQNYQNQQTNFNNILQSQGIIPQLEQVQQYFTQLQQQQFLQGNQQKQQDDLSQNIQSQYQVPSSQQISTNNDQFNNDTPNGFISDTPQQTTEPVLPKVSSAPIESTTINNNRVNNIRRDPLRQRYRGRNSYQTTTTTEHATTPELEVPVHQSHRVKERPHHQQAIQNVQIVQENNNFQDNYPTNTERSDEQSPTERNQGVHYNNDNRQSNINNNFQNYPNIRPILNSDTRQIYHEQFSDQQVKPQNNDHYVNNQQINIQTEDVTTYSDVKETTPVSNLNAHNSQPTYTDTSSKYEDRDHVTEKPINQQRLTKYTRVRGRVSQQREQQPEEYESSVQENPEHISSDSNSEPELEQITTTPKPVRVRGRVRNRQRTNGVRQTTTTEPPNYPIESGLVTNTDSQYVRRPPSHRTHSDRTVHRQSSSNRFRNNNYNTNNENVENESQSVSSSSTASLDDATTTEALPVSRKYNHILNRNVARRPNANRQVHQTTTTTSSPSVSTAKYLVRTTRRPVTQVTKLQDGRGRIRRPNKSALTSTTTEYPPLNNGQENFAPSAASNEVLDPYYPTQTHHSNNSPNRNSNKYNSPVYESSTILTPTPFAPAGSPVSNSDDYWNQGFTIQQSNSYDFSAESSPVTQSTLSTRYVNDDQEDDDGYNHRSTAFSQDQTPYSSNEQYVAAYSKSKTNKPQQPSGKENQWNEKTEHETPTKSTVEQYEDEGYTNRKEHKQQHDNENRRPVYHNSEQVSEQSENNKYISSSNNEDDAPNPTAETQMAYTASEDLNRNKDNNFNGRKPVDPVTGKKSGRRRGAWVRVRVNKKPKDVFETAESQNLASVSNNAIKSADKSQEQPEKEYTIPANHRPTDPYSTDIPQTTVVGVTTLPPQTTPTTKYDDIFGQSLTDMIREIIKEGQKEEEEEENKKLAEGNANTTITTTISPVSSEGVTESQSVITTTPESNVAVTVLPEVTTQVSPVESEDVTKIIEEITTTVEPKVIIGTSTTTEISLETEICYRGRCVKSKKNKKPFKPSTTSTPEAESDLMSVE